MRKLDANVSFTYAENALLILMAYFREYLLNLNSIAVRISIQYRVKIVYNLLKIKCDVMIEPMPKSRLGC